MKKLLLLFLWLYCSICTAGSKDKLTVILDWFPNPDHAPLFVAQQQGYFAKEGLEVKLVGPADPSEPPKLAAAKKADLAITYQPQLMLQVSQGLPLARVATLIATPLDCLVVLDTSNIKQAKDLKGKKIGYSSPGTGLVNLTTMLKQAGLSLKDVQLINVHYNLTQALLTKQVDAITGVMRNFELTQIRLAGFNPIAFYPEEQGVPPYDELVIITHQDNLADPRFARFIRALEQGTQYLINHSEASWQLFAKEHPQLNNPLNHQAWLDTIPRFALRPGAVDQKRYENFSRFLKTQQIITKEVTIKNYQ